MNSEGLLNGKLLVGEKVNHLAYLFLHSAIRIKEN